MPDVDLNEEQAQALHDIVEWFHEGWHDEFRLGGLAGTGKTTIVGMLPQMLGLHSTAIRFVAPTGKAARVLSRKLPSLHMATTLHALMYLPRENHCAECMDEQAKQADEMCHGMRSGCGCRISFEWQPPDPPPQLIVCDEASMVSRKQRQHLRDIGTRVLYVGDHGQLPPVEGTADLMEEDNLDCKLERIHRQVADSPILKLAMLARTGKPLEVGDYGQGVHVVERRNMNLDIDDRTLLLCYSNKERMLHNARMRNLLGRSGQPTAGERLVCLKNNNEVGIVNGMMGTLAHIETRANGYYVRVDLDDDDRRQYGGVILKQQFNSAETLHVRWADVWTYGYCLTTHKAQGSEADDVVVFKEDGLRHLRPPINRNRWLYTAITRAKRTLTVVI